MSRLTSYHDYAVTAQDCLDGRPPPDDMGKFQYYTGPIQFPLAKAKSSTLIFEFYQSRNKEVERSGLEKKRKNLYRRFKDQVFLAHVAIEQVKGPFGTARNLRGPLAHLFRALNLMTELKDYDDECPVNWSEVYPCESMQVETPPGDFWSNYKLESIQPCLVLLVQIFRLMFPDRSDIWDECERSLELKEWIFSFVLDSEKSQRRSMPPYPPTRSEIVGHVRPTG
ncbi:hypothetical protein F4779DRAFT_226584 [Xylariaceae sp. FL0662B]|nr:hypothetical protein F4779DRAFT_226584 [Xylariaceae sp. FL0662B]